MIKRLAAFIFLGLCLSNSYAQDDSDFIKQGLLKGTATISPAFMLQYPFESIYINGELEFFTEKRISVRSDAYLYVGSQKKTAMLNQNSFIVSGALYHFPKKNFDYFIGFQPGVSFSQPIKYYLLVNPYPSLYELTYPLKVCPTISLITGITYYVDDYFNFFLNVRYTKARYFGYNSSVLNLDQLILSAGLGFDIKTKKQ